MTCTYAGLRAATEHQDYQIHFYPSEGYITVGGIRSTGLSSSLGIAEYVVQGLLSEFEMSASLNIDWTPSSGRSDHGACYRGFVRIRPGSPRILAMAPLFATANT